MDAYVFLFRRTHRLNSGILPWLVSCCLTMLRPASVLADTRLTVCGEAGLRAAASAGGTVTLDCDGVIKLSSPLEIRQPVSIDGSGHNVTIDGGEHVRLFIVLPVGSLTLKNLTLTHGAHRGIHATNDLMMAKGGAVMITGGQLTALDCRFEENFVWGGSGVDPSARPLWERIPLLGGRAQGGAIYCSDGILSLERCVFSKNQSVGGEGGEGFSGFYPSLPGGEARGGAIYSSSSSLNIRECAFDQNKAVGGLGGEYHVSQGGLSDSVRDRSGNGFGGALYFNTTTGVVSSCSLSKNAGMGAGGAMYHFDGSLRMNHCSIVSNICAGAESTTAKFGITLPVMGGGVFNAGLIELNQCLLAANEVIGEKVQRGNGGDSLGGGIFNKGRALVQTTTLQNNRVTGGLGASIGSARDGWAKGGAIYNDQELVLLRSLLVSNSAWGLQLFGTIAGAPGDGWGGGIYNAGRCFMTNSTLAYNDASGGVPDRNSPAGEYIPGGNASGGAVHQEAGAIVLNHVTIAGNRAVPGPLTNNSTVAIGGGIRVAAGSLVLNNSLFANSVSGGNLVLAAGVNFDEVGVNLNSDSSLLLAHGINHVDPVLEELGDYGGPTLTFALGKGSPALDAARSESCPYEDQRAFARPFGSGCDIGAFESHGEFSSNFLVARLLSNLRLQIRFYAASGTKCRLEGSQNGEAWQTIKDGTVLSKRWIEFEFPVESQKLLKLYRITGDIEDGAR